jgi:predicted nucleic acid-binding protein
MRVALDTTVLAYAEGIGDAIRCNIALQLIQCLPVGEVILPAQVLGELYRILVGKERRDPIDARTVLLSWADYFDVVDSTWFAFQSAFDLAADHRLQIWDALILSVAAENHCRLLISEDMQDGFTWRGVTIADPFKNSRSPILDRFLATSSAGDPAD